MTDSTSRRQSFAEDGYGYPNMTYEAFFQRGIECFTWSLPRHLRRQAFDRLLIERRESALTIESWKVRAFLCGVRGGGKDQRSDRLLRARDYVWPTTPDRSWDLVVCSYRGQCELDFVHKVSRRFWSEDNEFIAAPDGDAGLLWVGWYQMMGFDIIYMSPSMRSAVGETTDHLSLVTVAASRSSTNTATPD